MRKHNAADSEPSVSQGSDLPSNIGSSISSKTGKVQMRFRIPIATKEQQCGECIEALKEFLYKIPHQFFVIKSFSPVISKGQQGQQYVLVGDEENRELMRCEVTIHAEHIEELSISYEPTVMVKDDGEIAGCDFVFEINYGQKIYNTAKSYVNAEKIMFPDNDVNGSNYYSLMMKPGRTLRVDSEKSLRYLSVSRESKSSSSLSSTESLSSELYQLSLVIQPKQQDAETPDQSHRSSSSSSSTAPSSSELTQLSLVTQPKPKDAETPDQSHRSSSSSSSTAPSSSELTQLALVTQPKPKDAETLDQSHGLGPK